MDLRVTRSWIGEQGDVMLVHIVGEVDVYTHPVLRDFLRAEVLEAAGPPRHVGLELSGVDFFDSTAFGVCVGFLKQFRRLGQAGAVAMVAPTDKVRTAIEVTGMTQVFPLADDAADFLRVAGEWERATAAPDGVPPQARGRVAPEGAGGPESGEKECA